MAVPVAIFAWEVFAAVVAVGCAKIEMDAQQPSGASQLAQPPTDPVDSYEPQEPER